MKKVVSLEKMEATEVMDFSFSKADKEKLVSQKKKKKKKKKLMILKILLFHILARLIDQYVVFIQKRCLEMPPEKDHVGVL